MGKIEISVPEPSVLAQLAAEIEPQLLSSLADQNEQAVNTTVGASAFAPDGNLIGGVFGATSYGWLLVKLLWVHQDYRQMGISRTLMAQAEKQAKTVGCHSAWLETSNLQARQVYSKLGYNEFAVLENAPDRAPSEHRRWFMKKRL